MGIHAAQIGPDEDVGHGGGVDVGHPGPYEHIAREAGEGVGRDGDGRRARRRTGRFAHLDPAGTGKYLSSQLRTSVTTSVLPSESTKWTTLATRWRSVGWPACRKRSFGWSAGVAEPFAGCRSKNGRGEILAT